MIVKSFFYYLLTAILVVTFSISSYAQNTPAPATPIKTKSAKPGLLILSHGSPSPRWNDPVNNLVKQVRLLNEKNKQFLAVEGAFLEFTSPNTVDGIEKLEKVGCDRIVVVPLFIAPSSHSHFDVPAALGLYSSPQQREMQKKENILPALPHVPIILTQTMNEGDLLLDFVYSEVTSLSTLPSDEALVLIAHGDPGHKALIDEIILKSITNSCGKTGISYGDWAYCEVGQSYLHQALPVILKAADNKKRVLVVGLYLSSSAQSIHSLALNHSQGPMDSMLTSSVDGIDIVFSKQGVVQFNKTAPWIFKAAADALTNCNRINTK